MPTAAEDLKLFKYREKKVQERLGGLAHNIQQKAQSLAACFVPDFPMSQHPVFQFSKQAIAYPNKWSNYMGSYFMVEGGRRNAAFTWNTESHRVAMHSYPQCFPGGAEIAMQRREGLHYFFQYRG